MAKFLIIETTTENCSVALSKDGAVVAVKESTENNAHSKNVDVFINEICKESNIALNNIDAIVVSKGPGSYTGLRIGVSTAKGICYALNKPLIAVSSLEALAFHASKKYSITYIFYPMIDARRMEVYSAIWKVKGRGEIEEIRDVQAEIIDKNSIDALNFVHKILLLGNGATKFKETFAEDKRIVFDDEIQISATNMVELAEKAFEKQDFEDVAYFTPFYLKDFIAGMPKVKGLK
ncbi:MAG: tRNA (adenosine(37)-N6)-threonylcarbamoyltransferase complex dimerization subunit type 1 TsaB [Bacteroidales bacterium]|jgi:tRNA threonylcarbamoyladenosine biosynthesis protein TsaB|nr:tRNA (adenosine(37)-N6)-threonylcarbamoyltransferase complex dimerization subunit type 1 TsaB [Bacteroidales bacterium]